MASDSGERSAAGEFRAGWPALLATMVGNAGGLAAVPLFALSSFIAPLKAEFGWSSAAIGAAATIITLAIFLTGPVVGRYCDRYGARRLTLPSIVLFAAAIAALTLIGSSVASLYAGYVLLGVTGAATTSVAYSRVVNLHFERARGLALAIMMTGSGIGAVVLPLMLSAVIGSAGWRAGFLACAAVALLPLPFVWALIRDRPVQTDSVVAPRSGITARQAMATRRFWIMAAAILCFAPTAGAFIVHILPILAELGLSGGDGAGVAALLGIGMIAGRLTSGLLLDRTNGPLPAILLTASTAVGFLLLHAGVAALAPVAVLLVGLTLGAEGDLLAYFTVRYFGMRSYAELFGWLFGIIALGTAAGPLLVVVLQEADGSYATALLVFALQCVAAAILFITLGRYPDQPPSPAAAPAIPPAHA